ncbi:hypothetical protein Q7C36_008039 [Tachysurus vachellii]|uniref:Uncharacterized protein n=1 Tax=Tachysurus vachellii TaxID=175792 RepID=A0AA88SVC2_TACVA|nr:hypothetical protein Q7C36_008039 [Tachysurus vachellii]
MITSSRGAIDTRLLSACRISRDFREEAEVGVASWTSRGRDVRRSENGLVVTSPVFLKVNNLLGGARERTEGTATAGGGSRHHRALLWLSHC